MSARSASESVGSVGVLPLSSGIRVGESPALAASSRGLSRRHVNSRYLLFATLDRRFDHVASPVSRPVTLPGPGTPPLRISGGSGLEEHSFTITPGAQVQFTGKRLHVEP